MKGYYLKWALLEFLLDAEGEGITRGLVVIFLLSW